MESIKKSGATKKKPAASLTLPSGVEANLDALRRGADILQIDFNSPNELVQKIREHVAKIAAVDADSIAECDTCNEQSTLETDFCPFCGDSGVEQVVETTATPHPTTAKMQAGHEARLADAEEAKSLIHKYEKDYTRTMYELGQQLHRVREEKLWSAHGESSFRKWVTNHTNVSIRYADQIADIAKNFTKEQYIQLGTAKLAFALRIEDEDRRKALLADAADGNLTLKKMREGADDAIPINRKKAPTADAPLPPPPAEEKPRRAPKPKPQIGLLGKVDGAPRAYHFIDAETGAKLPNYIAGSYIEIPISADVVLRATPVLKDKEVVKIKAMFVRVEPTEAAGESADEAAE